MICTTGPQFAAESLFMKGYICGNFDEVITQIFKIKTGFTVKKNRINI